MWHVYVMASDFAYCVSNSSGGLCAVTATAGASAIRNPDFFRMAFFMKTHAVCIFRFLIWMIVTGIKPNRMDEMEWSLVIIFK
jgi:hypothetical protein